MPNLRLDVQDLVRLATPGTYKGQLKDILEAAKTGETEISYFRLATEMCRLAAVWEQDMTLAERDTCKQQLWLGLSSLVWTFEAMMQREHGRSKAQSWMTE